MLSIRTVITLQIIVSLFVNCHGIGGVSSEAGVNESSKDALISSGVIPKPIQSHGPFAYVTLHYEGTPRDDEYFLGIRVLIKSIQLSGSKHDIVVITPETVSQSTKQALRDAGAKIYEVQGIKNPYKDNADRRASFQQRFDQTLNKLHLWNMTKYERVIYMDADNVLLESLDELFYCGHFCAVFMNVAVFHTGLMVVKPDAQVFQDMLEKLQTEESYDGADQGFLVSYFPHMLNAPLFIGDGVQQMSEESANRLPVNYNLNHIYYYEKASWNFYRRHHFADKRIPALSIGYPIAPNLKPWYWWSYIWLPIHYEWYEVRVQLTEKFTLLPWIPYMALVASAISFELLNGITILTLWKKYHLTKLTQHWSTRWLMILLWFCLTVLVTYKSIPCTIKPSAGLWTFIVTQNILFFSLFHKICHTPKSIRLKVFLCSFAINRALAFMSSADVTLVYRVLIWVFGFELFVFSEISLLYFSCFRPIKLFSSNAGIGASLASLNSSIFTEDSSFLGFQMKTSIHHTHSGESFNLEAEEGPVMTKSIAV